MGQLAPGNTRRTTVLAGQRMRAQVSLRRRSLQVRSLPAVFVLLGISLATVVFAQSGRNQEKAPKPAPAKTKSSGSIAGPTTSPTPPNSQTRSSGTQSPPRKDSSDDIDEADTVRIVSNLVPIPATVVDPKGIAITGLKLED